MHVTYGFVYYFCLFMVALTIGLSIFIVRTFRKKFFDFLKRVKLMDHFLIQSAVYISFIVILVILVDSVWTYYSLRKNLQTGNTNIRDFALDKFELVRAQHKQDYLQLYRNYREYYLAERNFMLTSSALFIYFVFQRLCAAISKLNDLENQIESGTMQPSTQKLEKDKTGKVKGA